MKQTSYFQEIKDTLKLAIPMILGGVGGLSMNIVDIAMLGNLSTEQIAAATLGGAAIAVPFVVAISLCIGIQIIVATHRGANTPEKGFDVLKHGLLVSVSFAILVGTFFSLFPNIIMHFGQEAKLAQMAKPYMLWTAWSLVFSVIWQCLKNFSEAFEKSWMPFITLCFMILVNVPLNYIFIYGLFGLPQMGATGAGIGTFLARAFAAILIISIFAFDSKRRVGWHLEGLFKFNLFQLKKVLSLGVPAGVQTLFDFGFFTFTIFVAGWFGAVQLASYQVVCNVAGLAFMVVLCTSHAIGIRIGEAYGAGRFGRAKRIAYSCVIFSCIFMAFYCLVVLFLGETIARQFTNDLEVINLIKILFIASATYLLSDGIQTSFTGALRGLYDIKVPLLIIFISYWVVSFLMMLIFAFGKDVLFLGYKVPFGLGLKSVGILLSFTVGLTFASVFLWIRFLKKSRMLERLQAK